MPSDMRVVLFHPVTAASRGFYEETMQYLAREPFKNTKGLGLARTFQGTTQ